MVIRNFNKLTLVYVNIVCTNNYYNSLLKKLFERTMIILYLNLDFLY